MMKCKFCKSEFKTETRFKKHQCELMKRHSVKDTKTSLAAFMMWTEFKKRHHLRAKPNYDGFLKSKQYKAFIKFQLFLEQIQPLNQEKYFDYLIDNNVPFYKWTSEEFYLKWVKIWVAKETPDQGVSRSIGYLLTWCIEQNIDPHDWSTVLSPNRLSVWIKSGKISPWLVFLSRRANLKLKDIPDHEQHKLEEVINPLYWRMRLKDTNTGTLTKDLEDAGF